MDQYKRVINWLFKQLPVYQNSGSRNYKIDLKKSLSLMEALGHPQNKFPSFHIAGTNGKGSTSHMLASILQAEGFKVGLYTSPHLLDFRERIRINGKLISKKAVVDFIEHHQTQIKNIKLSFFELTVGMAFSAFEQAQVDIAIIEVGLGGRLDSTNVITPIVSAITNVDLDHMEFLGNTRKAIALEKAGIFKKNIPVVIGQKDKETENVFIAKAKEVGTEIIWAKNNNSPIYEMDLLGDYQIQNQRTALTILQSQNKFNCSENSIKKGLKNITKLTGISGRWQIVNDSPFIVIDSAHNSHGMSAAMTQWRRVLEDKSRGFMILGAVKDKDLNFFWDNIPKECILYYTKPSIPRGLPVQELYLAAKENDFSGIACDSFSEAFQQIKTELKTNDALYVGGSTFLVADALKMMEGLSKISNQALK